MSPTKYTELTGITVKNEALTKAQINRTRSMLETMLGYPLCSSKQQENLYNELGKSQEDCACPDVNLDNLDDPDEVQGAYRLFPYNRNDMFLAVDPFVKFYKAKLVFVKAGDGANGVTLKTFDEERIRVEVGRQGFSKYLENCKSCWCDCNCDECVQLAIDAEWGFNEQTIPEDLKFVWAEMVTYYSNPKQDVKSESILTHSYTKFDRVEPQLESHNMAVIKKYAGPFGSVTPAGVL